MALEQGDSQVSAPAESSISSSQDNMQSIAADNQAGVCQSVDDFKAANDKFMTDLGFPSANILNTCEQDDPGDMQQPANQRPEVQETQKPDAQGDVKELSPENQQQLSELQSAGAKACADTGCDLAATQKALQEQADKYGTNPDGSPKVSVLAGQTNADLPETNFYASFNGNRSQQQANQLLLEGARQYGDPRAFPSSTVGHIGTVYGGNGPAS